MGVWSRLVGRPESQGDVLTLDDVMREYDLVDVHDEFMVVAERPKKLSTDMSIEQAKREMGSSSVSPWTSWVREEHNAEMRGLRGLQNCDKMRRSDGTVRGTLRLIKTPVLAARWFMEPTSESTRDQNVANFVWKNLTEWMSISWPQLLTEALLMTDFGYYMFEKVFIEGEKVTTDTEAKGKYIWQKFAPRHPMDVQGWHYDRNGGPAYVTMNPSCPEDPPEGVDIDISKLMVFSFDKEGGSMEGISVLRSAYQHWYYKTNLYKIDAIQKERHGIGIPVIKLPPNFSIDDRKLAEDLGRNLRTNERAHVVLPPNWELLFAKLEGQPVDALASAKHHDEMIRANILAEWMGGNAKAEDQIMFLKSTRFIADIVTDVINKYAIPQLVDYNWSRVGYPKLRARRIGEQADWRTMSFAVRNLIGANALRPDDRLEEWLREEMDLPKIDPDTIRQTATPQAGTPAPGGTPPTPPGAPEPPEAPAAGPPRQAPAAGQKGLPGSAAGRDGSGG